MKDIHQLIPDIYRLVGRRDGWFTTDIARQLGEEIALKLGEHYNRQAQEPRLRLSQMGPKCPKALWYSIHHPELAEPLPPEAILKFSYGHILEAQAIALAKAAGHDVQGEQDELDVLGVKGHRDCIIDGYVVDVKSCSTISFKKFKDRSLEMDDSFGYLDQLDGYLVGSADDDLVKHKDVAFDWAIDKTLGKMVLYEHRLRSSSIRERIKLYREIVERPTPPACECGTIGDETSGNVKLDVRASYSAQKHTCFPHLRTFVYAGGVPQFFTRVVKPPRNKYGPLIEVDKYGRNVYTS